MRYKHSSVPKGRCARCNHHLTRPESIADRLGPVCKNKIGLTEVQSEMVQKEIRKAARDILDAQKRGETYKGKKRSAHSNFFLWKKNKSLVEGW